MNNFISASIIAADFWNLEREYKELNKTKVEWIHYDIMDGHFVPNITIGSCELDSLVNKSNIAIDIHFMVSNPDYIVPYFVEKYKGTIVKNITVHSEVCINVKKLSEIVRKNGINFGLAIKPKTSINRIVENIGFIDLALVMTVEPGFAGQSLIKSCLKKITRLNNYLRKNNLDIPIQVDGGIKLSNISELKEAGSNIIVSGTGIFNTKNYKQTVDKMDKIIKQDS
ncbi:MAG: ribulose-phosphate 3-epimerase [Deltaproteobacteria bacterium TMED126]|jgi:ribulose-phosphate 3-epimerase|nr:ribulose-phosphate 3-epimerase [Candidatus Dadabacteria bacterium]NSW97009.1 ribulose-phosphate 3-epimerase [Deltaproteobacteria bacterium TMED126]|tara:strand:+ start:1690 stop:2367 length:678 start_codon:yes stop_codon:yes gene_type:complete